jgi:hypothetical protein
VRASGVRKQEAMMGQRTEHRSFGVPDEVREFPNGRAEILNVGDSEVGRLIFEPDYAR